VILILILNQFSDDDLDLILNHFLNDLSKVCEKCKESFNFVINFLDLKKQCCGCIKNAELAQVSYSAAKVDSIRNKPLHAYMGPVANFFARLFMHSNEVFSQRPAF
jgi:hypothetical protein